VDQAAALGDDQDVGRRSRQVLIDVVSLVFEPESGVRSVHGARRRGAAEGTRRPSSSLPACPMRYAGGVAVAVVEQVLVRFSPLRPRCR